MSETPKAGNETETPIETPAASTLPPAAATVLKGTTTEAEAVKPSPAQPAKLPNESEKKYQIRIAELEDENRRLKEIPGTKTAKADRGIMEKFLAGESL